MSRPQRSAGIPWGPFRLRIPFIHTKFMASEFFQGLSISAATGLALVPLLTGPFGLTFGEAVVMSMIHAFLISSAWMMFGEPYAPGWVTPALPFVITFVVSDSFVTPAEKFQAMTALSLDFALILVVLGVTGLGGKLVRIVPDVLKGGIIMGAALAAFLQIFDLEATNNVLVTQTFAATTALALSLILAFSEPLHRLQAKYPMISRVVSLGLLPGFIVAGLVGYFTGELHYDIQWGILDPPVMDLWNKVSPFVIGWPSFGVFLECLPLALITYIILFGDMVTGEEILKEAAPERPDEPLEINNTRSHLSLGIRNFLMGIFAPFFPTQGALWTGIHVVVVQRWRRGPKVMGSLYDGIASYYVFNIPLLMLILPTLTLLKPLMGIALLMTLALTGFACTSVALDMAKTAAQRGVLLLTAVCLCLFEPWQGLLIGVLATVLMIDIKPPAVSQKAVGKSSIDGKSEGAPLLDQ